MNPTHHTCRGMEAHGTFSLNLPSPDLVQETDWCGINSGERVSKAEVFDVFHGKLETAPMISACRFTAECEVVQKVVFEVDTVYFGEVVTIFANEDALKDGTPDWKKIDPLIFTFPDNSYWRLGEYIGKAWEIGKGYEPKNI
jgi:flavin reductase (DIM6/NTAB) family NADH-FMN oxidoreductase RutF